MGGRGRTAEDLVSLRTIAGATAAALIAVAAFGVMLGGPTWLKLVAGGLGVLSALVTLVLHVAERRAQRRDAGSDKQRLEQWRLRLRAAVLDHRVEQDGQLDHMIRDGEWIPIRVRLAGDDTEQSGPEVGGRLYAWEEIEREWDPSEGRLVISGEPGFGKTVAALKLVANVNGRDDHGKSVAEIFPLAEWYRWHSEHRTRPLADWLAEQLTLSYPRRVPLARAQQLISAGLVLPVLDGLDEIPTAEERRDCVRAIEAYTRRVEPHRPFALTCRAAEYKELVPKRVAAERHVEIAELQPDQVSAFLASRTDKGPGWTAIRARYAAGDEALGELFRSPLYLTIAVQAYGDSDPGELLDLGVEDARARLWDLLLATSAGDDVGVGWRVRVRHRGFRDETQVRRWLGSLATGMRGEARQRFRLHELYLIDPDPDTSLRRFRKVLTRSFTLAAAVAAGLAGGFNGGLAGGLAGALCGATAGALVGGLSGGLGPRQTIARAFVGWRDCAADALSRWELLVGLFVALPVGLVAWLGGGLGGDLIDGLVFGAFLALFAAGAGGLIMATMDWSWAAHARLGSDMTEPSTRSARRRSDAAIAVSRNAGLASLLAIALVDGLIVGLVGWVLGGVAFGVGTALIFGLTFGTASGLVNGLEAWLYYYWLRWHLSATGLLPRRLPAFLRWCAEPAREWLRITDAYEFRHRELLDHLADEAWRARIEEHARATDAAPA